MEQQSMLDNGRTIAKLMYEFGMTIFLPQMVYSNKPCLRCECRLLPESLAKHLASQYFISAINLENLEYSRPLGIFEIGIASEILYETIGYPDCYKKNFLKK